MVISAFSRTGSIVTPFELVDCGRHRHKYPIDSFCTTITSTPIWQAIGGLQALQLSNLDGRRAARTGMSLSRQ
jgi:hypothetical protein